MKEGLVMDSPLAGNARSEKVLWYQEVLALDPNSRIFLPYARLLDELGRRSEAVDVLKAGLARHPEFLEARLFLIDLLHYSGRDVDAGFEADGIIDLLSQASALWRIWSRKPGLRADQAAILLFFASAMQKGGHSLSDVFEAGIAALEGSSVPVQAAETKLPAAAPADSTPSVLPAGDSAKAFTMPEDAPWHALDSVPDDDIYDEDDAFSPVSALLFAQTSAAAIPEPTPTALPAQTEVEHIPAMSPVPRGVLEGKSSLCTRSMARVLEEQGATAEAADIYRELLDSCSSQEEQDELSAKLASLLQSGDSPASAQPSTPGIIDMLESLADRLENRNRV